MTVSAYENLIFDAEHQLGLDVYQDNTRRQAVLTRPAVILIHGGGWFCGDKSGEADIATWLAENGYLVIAPNYRLYRQAQYPGAYTDVFNVYRWLQNSSLEFNHDRIGAYGYSAGGTMAVALSNSYGIPVVSLSGVYDIAGWMEKNGHTTAMSPAQIRKINPQRFGDTGPVGRVDEFYVWFIKNFFNQNDPDLNKRYKEASVINQVSTKSGPMFLANGLDELVPPSDALNLSAALVQAGVPVTTQFVQEKRHAKAFWKQVNQAVLAFLAQYL